MTSPVFLEGETVTLHPVEKDDAEFFHRILNDPEVRRGIAGTEPVSLSQEEEYVESVGDGDDVQFTVRADGDRVGTIGLNDLNQTFGNAEVGYFFAPEAWGNGYATDATETVVEYAFTERRLHRVYARVFAFNDASQRVLEKVGFEHEGTHREQAYIDGEYVDAERYGVLEGDWRPRER